LITKIIQTAQGHLTAEQIYLSAKEEMPAIAVGTVYRNLRLMEENGEIRRISMPNAPDRFDKTTRMHDHLVCRICGNLLDVHFENLHEIFAGCADMQIDSYELMLYGVCPDCLKQCRTTSENPMNRQKI
jgi:Fe2+ or Zn2+ uptake regulation protein